MIYENFRRSFKENNRFCHGSKNAIRKLTNACAK